MVTIESNRINRFQTPEEVTPVIESYINDFEGSSQRRKMALGVDYYRSENTEIMNRRKLIYLENEDGHPIEMDDPYKANNKLPAGYFKILVDQKINYLLGNPINIETDDQEELDEVLPDGWQTKIKKAGKEASKKALGWLQVYVDEEGEFGLKNVPSEQIIPVYKADNNDVLEMVIRYYKVTTLNEDNEAIRVNRVEVWDDEMVTYYQENDKTGLYRLIEPERMQQIFGKPYQNPKYHFQQEIRYGERLEETEGLAWGEVPFIPIYNNDEGDYDLQPVKPFIDAYDIVNSDFVNNLEDFQDIYWILKGYQGENVSKFLEQVKRYKALKVAADGEAKAESVDIPHEAREKAKQGLERDIFTFGMGVNPNQVGDGNLTNVVIKSRYSNLDLKADQFEDEVREALYSLIYFVNRYRETQGLEPIDVDGFVFDRSMIMNEAEMLQANVQQRGTVSEDTRLRNHPWVSDPQTEKEKMEAEMSDYVDLDMVEDEEDDE